MPPAFFDVDHTLMKGYSGYYTTLALIRHGILKRRRLAQAALYRALSPVIQADVRRIYELVLGDLTGCTIDEVLAIGREVFEGAIRPRLYREGVAAVRRHRAAGEKIYLLSSGPYMTLKALGDFLGASAEFTCGPVLEGERLTARVREPLCYREGKVAAARAIAAREGAALADCAFYGDHLDDRFVLEAVGRPQVVNPGRRLAALARQRGWPCHRWELTA